MTVGLPVAFDAAIVDLDGTLVDTVGDFDVALNAHAGRPGLAAGRPRRSSRAPIGKGSEHLIASTLAESAPPAALFDAAWARYQHHYLAINGQHSTVYRRRRRGPARRCGRAACRLACLTNKPTAFARPLLARKGLDGYFEHVFGGDAFERKKPDPLPLLQDLRRARQRAGAHADGRRLEQRRRAARAAGCPVVLVSYGYNHGEPVRDAGADAVIDRPRRVADVLTAR